MDGDTSFAHNSQEYQQGQVVDEAASQGPHVNIGPEKSLKPKQKPTPAGKKTKQDNMSDRTSSSSEGSLNKGSFVTIEVDDPDLGANEVVKNTQRKTQRFNSDSSGHQGHQGKPRAQSRVQRTYMPYSSNTSPKDKYKDNYGPTPQTRNGYCDNRYPNPTPSHHPYDQGMYLGNQVEYYNAHPNPIQLTNPYSYQSPMYPNQMAVQPYYYSQTSQPYGFQNQGYHHPYSYIPSPGNNKPYSNNYTRTTNQPQFKRPSGYQQRRKVKQLVQKALEGERDKQHILRLLLELVMNSGNQLALQRLTEFCRTDSTKSGVLQALSVLQLQEVQGKLGTLPKQIPKQELPPLHSQQKIHRDPRLRR